MKLKTVIVSFLLSAVMGILIGKFLPNSYGIVLLAGSAIVMISWLLIETND